MYIRAWGARSFTTLSEFLKEDSVFERQEQEKNNATCMNLICKNNDDFIPVKYRFFISTLTKVRLLILKLKVLRRDRFA
jgi:hypothetical protein